jgi:predicted membrane-bound spermidine synthase
MSPVPVAILLLLDAVLLLSFLFSGKAGRDKDSIFLSLLFFFSGMPALIYQIVWQRALFAIYGVNAQSVAVVVTAFMLGLGAGSLAGGRLSAKFPKYGILIFGVAEFAVAILGLSSLGIFHWIARYTAGASLGSVIVFSVALLLVPTVLMGATLPLLVEHLVLHTNRVGASVSILYFVNTFGSALACFLCATFLLSSFGQSGAVTAAACINALVGATAYLYARGGEKDSQGMTPEETQAEPGETGLTLTVAMLLAGVAGFIALGFEIAWYRVFALASSDRAPAFALLLSTYLSGIAAGAYASEKWAGRRSATDVLRAVGVALALAGAISVFLPPLVASLMARKIPFLASAPAFFAGAALVGCVLPLLCRLAITPSQDSGRRVSLVYVSNIVGSTAGSLGVGFFLMQYVGLRPLSLGLGLLAVALGCVILVFGSGKLAMPPAWASVLVVACLAAIPLASRFYPLLFERLIFGDRGEARAPFVHVVENRNGVIAVTQTGAVFGGGVYDGYFNVDPMQDSNLVARIYALSAFAPNPRKILVIGLATASWAQILANHPQLESLDAVEINPGYLQLIPQYPVVSSFPQNPKVRIYLDDGRRWLLAHPEAQYDAIVVNTTFNWRDHSSGLLSVEFLELIRAHLNSGGIYYFNSTESDESIATALRVFPYGLRVINLLAVSDSPISVDRDRWLAVLREYKIDRKAVFEPSSPAAEKVLASYMALAGTLNAPPTFFGIESSDSLRKRLGRLRIITDDNMGQEWSRNIQIPWH